MNDLSNRELSMRLYEAANRLKDPDLTTVVPLIRRRLEGNERRYIVRIVAGSEDIISKSIDCAALTKCEIPIIVVYRQPKDYPDKYVARLYDGEKPTNIVVIADTIEAMRAMRPPWMMSFARDPNDDDVIVESWI